VVDYATLPNARWHLTAARGSMAGEGRYVRLEGDVRLSRPLEAGGRQPASPAVVRTEHLLLDTVSELATTADPVRIELAPHTLAARGMRADLKRETLRLEAAVDGRYAR
jgi:LPS export ABC transporter protein LptC